MSRQLTLSPPAAAPVFKPHHRAYTWGHSPLGTYPSAADLLDGPMTAHDDSRPPTPVAFAQDTAHLDALAAQRPSPATLARTSGRTEAHDDALHFANARSPLRPIPGRVSAEPFVATPATSSPAVSGGGRAVRPTPLPPAMARPHLLTPVLDRSESFGPRKISGASPTAVLKDGFALTPRSPSAPRRTAMSPLTRSAIAAPPSSGRPSSAFKRCVLTPQPPAMPKSKSADFGEARGPVALRLDPTALPLTVLPAPAVPAPAAAQADRPLAITVPAEEGPSHTPYSRPTAVAMRTTPLTHAATPQHFHHIDVTAPDAALSPARCVKPKKPSPTGAMAYRVGALRSYVEAGLEAGSMFLRPSEDGEGGTYFVVASKGHGGGAGEPVAVFKPADEELGAFDNPHGHTDPIADARDGFVPGTGMKREVLAHALDHGHAAGVPETVEAVVDGRVGSLQRFVPRMQQSWSTTPGHFDTASVQRIALFDLRTLNGDRHGGNILVPKARGVAALVPIDHAYIVPDRWADPDFEWTSWPQSKAALLPEVAAEAARIDPDGDAAIVDGVLGRGAADLTAVLGRMVRLAAGRGYTVREMAAFCRRPHLTEAAGLETLLADARVGCLDEDPLSDDWSEEAPVDLRVAERLLDEAFPGKDSV